VHRGHAWDPIVPLLADHHRVVVVDLPGHGESPDVPADAEPVAYMADRLAESVREVTPAGERPHIAGNSLGGFLGLEMGARGLASGVTALSPAGLFRSDADRRHAGRLFSSISKAAAVAGPAIPALSRTAIGRSLFMAGFSARPWRRRSPPTPAGADHGTREPNAPPADPALPVNPSFHATTVDGRGCDEPPSGQWEAGFSIEAVSDSPGCWTLTRARSANTSGP